VKQQLLDHVKLLLHKIAVASHPSCYHVKQQMFVQNSLRSNCQKGRRA